MKSFLELLGTILTITGACLLVIAVGVFVIDTSQIGLLIIFGVSGFVARLVGSGFIYISGNKHE